MIKIDFDKIKKIAYSDDTFSRGANYYKEGLVKNVHYNSNLGLVEATVEGTEDYSVSVYLNKEEYLDSECNCYAYHKWEEPCKHIVATLLFLMIYHTNQMNNKSNHSNNVFDDIVESYIKNDWDIDGFIEEKNDLGVKYSLEFDKYKKVMFLSINLGIKNMYVLKNPKAFFDCVFNKLEYEFGKNYTYNPQMDNIKEKDFAIFSLLYEIINEGDYINKSTYRNYDMRYVDGKKFLLTNNYLKRLLLLLEDSRIDFAINNTQYKDTEVMNKDIDFVFSLAKEDNNIKLYSNELDDVEFLTKDYSVLFYDDSIYSISNEQRRSLMPIFHEIKSKGNEIIFDKDSIGKYMSYIYPEIRKTANIQINSDVEDNLYYKECKAKMYLDIQSSGITAEIKYIYGDYEYDSLNESENEENPDIIIVRDAKLENRIMDIVENSAFRVVNNTYYMEEEVDIYDFIVNIIPRLSKLIDIYYSDELTFMNVRDKSSMSFSSNLNEGTDYFNFNFSVDGIDNEEIPKILMSLKEKKKYYRLSDGSFMSLESQALTRFSNLINELDINEKMIEDGSFKMPTYKAFYLNDEIEEMEVSNYKRNLPFKELILRIKEPQDETYEIPSEVKDVLREYQVTGFNWLKNLSEFNFGGILADDMGLGKTIQILTYIKAEVDADSNKKTLIVAPTSLVYNWYREIKKFIPDLKILVVDGSKGIRSEKIKLVQDYDILITSYALVRNDIEEYRNLGLFLCILDEAQHIKNPNSKITKAVKTIVAERRFALTGTPIENSIMELWSIFDYIMPGYLGGITKFKQRYESQVGKENNSEDFANLKKIINPFILRRLKKDVLKELPDKIENKIVVDLTEDQKKIYLAYLEKIKNELENEYKEKGFQSSRIKILAGLTRLRQICCYPGLFLEDYEGGSAKLDLLDELIEELLEGGHRVLIFSQFTSMLDVIEKEITRKNIEYFRLDGSTKGPIRNELVDRFNEGEKSVFLISLKAGGTGLNLTGADTVIHVDPWWNPAVEEQATDRAHRIGQEKTVHVIKIITSGTIEEKIYQLQLRKKEMIDSIIKPGETMISKMSEDEIKGLFSI